MSVKVQNPGVTLKVTTKKEYAVTFSQEELRALINNTCNRFPYMLPADARFSIVIPDGGDYYAGARLDLNDEGVAGVLIEWTETETK